MLRSLWVAAALLMLAVPAAQADSFTPAFAPTFACGGLVVCPAGQTTPDVAPPKLIFALGSSLNLEPLFDRDLSEDPYEWFASSDWTTADSGFLESHETTTAFENFDATYDSPKFQQASDTTTLSWPLWGTLYFQSFSGLGTFTATNTANDGANEGTTTDTSAGVSNTVPEPSSLALVAMGFGALLVMRKRAIFTVTM